MSAYRKLENIFNQDIFTGFIIKKVSVPSVSAERKASFMNIVHNKNILCPLKLQVKMDNPPGIYSTIKYRLFTKIKQC